MSICVVGAGIIGLSTAIEIQKALPHAKVHLVAEKYSPHTTSDIAAGFWRPIYLGDGNKEQAIKWSQITFEHIKNLAKTDAQLYGAHITSGYEFSYEYIADWDTYLEPTINLYRLTQRQINDVTDETRMKHGIFYNTCFIEGSTYLPHLLHEFKMHGGTYERKIVKDLRMQASKYDIVVNCTGLASQHLANDRSTHPIRGQVFRLRAPFQRQFYNFHFDNDIDRYILPNNNWIVIGGTHDANDWSLEWRDDAGDAIYDDCTSLLPSLRYAPIISRHVGLRPGRPSVRVEAEILPSGRQIIHNYGHGGSGLTLFQGCALEAASLAKAALLSGANFSSKL